ncbi:hypothetical protein SAMN05444007_10617 [Cribrihabitans marinus]|uniref:MotA/TolQ/ExbB proton channel family protein n=1 Tax=Cribrihabitans marinus TaxID=1227549 RepID=A0A1H7AK13_9RHOB|nr:biopolymer transporter ExbB [Cribrihabitans marinus]GGH31609.1 hypothetical protein GCM10010973_22530 [Cribrihabitans marinus]SEJ64217.1 hypothetical protein SAMN05444007_10617 [Cribrihabitans marinus]
MAQAPRQARPQFSQPIRQILLMLIVIGLSGFGTFVALPRVLPVFEANPYLNGFILLVFCVGVLACFWQVIQLIGSVRWIEAFAGGAEHEGTRPPSLLAPLASLLRTRGARMQINSTSARSILDSVAVRIEEEREITRYITNVLIYLGLLGTFFGLATTVPAVVDTIRSLNLAEGENSATVFNRLMTGLEAQLGGMGVAFGSSLLGLAGSLIVGLLELFAGHGQNRFYRELEEWLTTITRLGFASGEESGGEAGAMAPMLDAMGEQMDALQEMFAASDSRNGEVAERLGTLVETISEMNQRQAETETTSASLDRIAAAQEALLDHMREQGPGEGLDAESRMRLRSIDVQMLRILEEISAGRQESLAELRKDVEILTKALMVSRGRQRAGE